MPTLKLPSILTDLGHVGENGLPVNSSPWFRHELDLCKDWGFRLKYFDHRVSLEFDNDQMVPYWIQKETPAVAWDFLRVNGFLQTESTNSEAIELARTGAPAGTLVFAEEQTAGKGRCGRSWFSSPRKGLYFSIVLHPSQAVQFWPLLTHVASVALIETMKDLHPQGIIPHPLELDLKWPNDVLISGRKCAGILLETITEAKKNKAVVGLGVNMRPGSVPDSLESLATSLDEMADTMVPRRQLLVRFLKKFQECYLVFERGEHRELLERWESHSSMWNGAEIWITEGENRRSAVTCGLNEIGALLVRTPEGKAETIFAGDVSIRRG
jgi:BirA family transcriptional regulator, biotin operon repressor / biotin---[acetyl-CoA-carboxylase] ligase